MKRSEIKVLIIEDDQNLGKALLEGVNRLGYSGKWCPNPDEGLSAFRLTEYHAVVLDCMLPKKNGVELADELRKMASHDFKIILMSGIFKDKSFSQDAVQRTGALAFFSKPFNFDQLKELLESTFADDIEADKEPLTELLMQEIPSLKDLKEALLNNGTRHGFELPYIFAALQGSQFSGHLNLVPTDRDVAQVSFSRGKIVDVKLKDVDSFFGVLMVEMGFTSPEEVEESLAKTGKPIGQLLVDASAVSPHAVNVVRSEQLAIRLSKTIQDGSVEVSLAEENVSGTDVSLSAQQFSIALHDWVSSKISRDWLANFYTQWLEYPLKITGNLERVSRLKDFPLLAARADVLAQINGKTSLQAFIDNQPEYETELLQAVHYGVLEKVFHFAPRIKTANDFRAMTQKLNRLSAGMDTKNHFELLGLNTNAKSKEISRAYLELAKTFHPDKIDPQAPAAFRQMNQKVFARMTQAYEILKDETKREAYLKELSTGSASEAFEAENTLDRARRMLGLGQFKQAEAELKPYVEGKYNLGQVRIHFLWARLKQISGAASSTQLTEMQRLLAQVPPEDRHSAVFFYVKALLYRASGDDQKAFQLLRNAVAIDPAMADARRDMLIMSKEHNSGSDWSQKFSKFLGGDKSSKKKRAA